MRRASMLVLLAAVAAGCGGSSSGDRLTRDEYASKADAICGKYKRETDALPRPSDLKSFASVADRTLSILDRARGELRKLRPPASEQATASAWLDQFDVLIGDIEKIRDKAKANDAAAVQQLAQTSLQHNAHANQLGLQLGMSVCSKD